METAKMKRVVIACDYHQTAQKVVENGYAVAHSAGLEIYLLHVINHYSHYRLAEPSEDTSFSKYMELDLLRMDSDEVCERESQKYLNGIKNFIQDTNIRTIVKKGNVAEMILKTADEIQADFIVIGSHSRKWEENTIMGSVAEEVFRNSAVPVLIVPVKKSQ